MYQARLVQILALIQPTTILYTVEINVVESYCTQTSIDIPFVVNGNGSNSYSIISGPLDSALSFPTAYQAFPDSSPLNVTFDVEGDFTLAFKHKTDKD